MKILNSIKKPVRVAMEHVALGTNKLFKGHVNANHVTVLSLLGHIAVVCAVVREAHVLAALLLVVFGLLDSVDGALARLQKKESEWGMVFDATTDRMKEGMVLGAIGYVFARAADLQMVAVTFAVLVLAVSISYVKAKAEVAIASVKKKHSETNRAFAFGLGGFEVRVGIVVAGLLFNQLVAAIWVLLAINSLTFIDRSMGIYKQLK